MKSGAKVLDSVGVIAENKRGRQEREPLPTSNPHREVSAMKATPSLSDWRAWSVAYEGKAKRRIIHRPFSDSTLEQLNYAVWFDAPEVC